MSNTKTKDLAKEMLQDVGATSAVGQALTKVKNTSDFRKELSAVVGRTEALLKKGDYEDIFYSEADAKKLGNPSATQNVNFQKYYFIVGRETRVAKPHVKAIKQWLGRMPRDKANVVIPNVATEDMTSNLK